MNRQTALYRSDTSPPAPRKSPRFQLKNEAPTRVPNTISEGQNNSLFHRRALLVMQALLSSVVTFVLLMLLLSWASQTILHLILEF